MQNNTYSHAYVMLFEINIDSHIGLCYPNQQGETVHGRSGQGRYYAPREPSARRGLYACDAKRIFLMKRLQLSHHSRKTRSAYLCPAGPVVFSWWCGSHSVQKLTFSYAGWMGLGRLIRPGVTSRRSRIASLGCAAACATVICRRFSISRKRSAIALQKCGKGGLEFPGILPIRCHDALSKEAGVHSRAGVFH